MDDNLETTLRPDAPLGYVLASQVFEHIPNPIKWLREISAVLKPGGRLALSLPDRRMTFDLFREESRPADFVSAYYADTTIPNIQSIYDNHTLATAVMMHDVIPDSMTPAEVIASRGATSPPVVTTAPLVMVELANDGQYLDAHCWVFNPASFLLVMAQLATDGFLRLRCYQFYPTNPHSLDDRGSSSFTIILEKVDAGVPASELRRSYLQPLGPGEPVAATS